MLYLLKMLYSTERHNFCEWWIKKGSEGDSYGLFWSTITVCSAWRSRMSTSGIMCRAQLSVTGHGCSIPSSSCWYRLLTESYSPRRIEAKHIWRCSPADSPLYRLLQWELIQYLHTNWALDTLPHISHVDMWHLVSKTSRTNIWITVWYRTHSSEGVWSEVKCPRVHLSSSFQPYELRKGEILTLRIWEQWCGTGGSIPFHCGFIL